RNTLFLSRRGRHTRFSRDWSSDVCSSDLAGGLGVLGTLVGALFGGGRGREADRAAAEARRVGNVPAIELHFTVNQTNTYNGAPSQPEIEQAFRRQANVLFEELYRRHLGPRLDRIEQRLGIAGAGA